MQVIEGGIIDFLSGVHVINNIIIGLYLKNQYLLVFLVGLLWEILEYGIVNTPFLMKIILKYYPVKIEKLEDGANKFFDLIFNMIGYYIGNNIPTPKSKQSPLYNIVKYMFLFQVMTLVILYGLSRYQ